MGESRSFIDEHLTLKGGKLYSLSKMFLRAGSAGHGQMLFWFCSNSPWFEAAETNPSSSEKRLVVSVEIYIYMRGSALSLQPIQP